MMVMSSVQIYCGSFPGMMVYLIWFILSECKLTMLLMKDLALPMLDAKETKAHPIPLTERRGVLAGSSGTTAFDAAPSVIRKAFSWHLFQEDGLAAICSIALISSCRNSYSFFFFFFLRSRKCYMGSSLQQSQQGPKKFAINGKAHSKYPDMSS